MYSLMMASHGLGVRPLMDEYGELGGRYGGKVGFWGGVDESRPWWELSKLITSRLILMLDPFFSPCEMQQGEEGREVGGCNIRVLRHAFY